MEKQGFIARLDRLGLVMQIVIGLAAGVWWALWRTTPCRPIRRWLRRSS